MSEKELEQEILALENEVKRLEDSTKEIIQSIKERIQNLKDIAWERESKKESSKMFKVLENEKPSTIVKSNIGNVIVDKEFMQKEISKHLDDTALRGMVTTEEMLSFPKVAKNVEAEYEERQQGYTWKVKADDESILNYGERDYGKGHRLLTAHSRTGRGERGQPHREFNDRNFHNPVTESIAQNKTSLANKVDSDNLNFNKDHFNALSIDDKLTLLQTNQQEITNLPRASEISIQQEEDTKHNNKQDEARHNKRIKK